MSGHHVPTRSTGRENKMARNAHLPLHFTT
jgi:hypothetical protein